MRVTAAELQALIAQRGDGVREALTPASDGGGDINLSHPAWRAATLLAHPVDPARAAAVAKQLGYHGGGCCGDPGTAGME